MDLESSLARQFVFFDVFFEKPLYERRVRIFGPGAFQRVVVTVAVEVGDIQHGKSVFIQHEVHE